MPVLKNTAAIATCAGRSQSELGRVDRGALVWKGGRILWVGPVADLPAEYSDEQTVDAGGLLVVPGLIDGHTHLAFGGWRSDEFEERCRGVSYAEIARRGGGIARTVMTTRKTSTADLKRQCVERLSAMVRLGVTTVECKSGYGLDTDEEVRILEIYRSVSRETPVRIVSTFLAHGVPAEEAPDRASYVRRVVEQTLPAVEPLAEFCDVFVEDGAFSVDEARIILTGARKLGMRTKVHADQLSNSGGAILAAELGATSADHLEFVDEDGIAAMARSGVVAVLLPLATTYLRQRPLNARDLIERGVDVALATDFNPGSAPSFHLPLAMTLACIQNGMTPANALKAVTLKAAKAIGRSEEIGSLEPGKRADFVLVEAPTVNHWLYHFTPNAVRRVYIGGRQIPTGSP
jgi:imidazolonepropionase